MAKVTFFAGLCGSGKTYEAEKLKRQYAGQGERAEMFEQIIGNAMAGIPDIPRLIRKLKEGIDCIVEEALYCMPHHRDCIQRILEQEVPGVEIKWFLFENNIEAANWNVQNRLYDNAMVARLIEKERLRLMDFNKDVLHPYYDAGCITTKPIHLTQ